MREFEFNVHVLKKICADSNENHICPNFRNNSYACNHTFKNVTEGVCVYRIGSF